MKRGEIWWASLPDPRGSEPGFRRPVLIIQSDAYNRSNISTVICLVLTSNLKHSNAPGNLTLPSRLSGLSRISVVNVSQILSVDKNWMTQRIKMLNPQVMHDIDDGLRLILSL